MDKQAPGRARDVREMAVRLERGFLASAAEGPLNHATAVDFEECLRLGATDVRDDEVVGTLLALAGYYFADWGSAPFCPSADVVARGHERRAGVFPTRSRSCHGHRGVDER